MAHLSSAKTTPAVSRFRYVDPLTDIEYRGEAHITRRGFDEKYEGGSVYFDACIQRIWRIDLADCAEISLKTVPASLILDIEAVAIEQYINPPSQPIELPTDWEVVKVERITCVLNVVTKNPLPAGLPTIGSALESVTPLHIPGQNAYVITSLLPPSDAIAAIRRMAEIK